MDCLIVLFKGKKSSNRENFQKLIVCKIRSAWMFVYFFAIYLNCYLDIVERKLGEGNLGEV
jgi:hypothetical protein